jgi:septal ring factor EnvC (AmiA/AmiB activator)
MLALRPLLACLVFAAALLGCADEPDRYLERQQIERERDRFEQKRWQLEQELRFRTEGKSQLSDADKTRIKEVEAQLREAQVGFESAQRRLEDL